MLGRRLPLDLQWKPFYFLFSKDFFHVKNFSFFVVASEKDEKQ